LKKISVVHPGIVANSQSSNQPKNLDRKKIALVFCARLVSMKRPLDALEILKHLQEMNIGFEFRLTVVGLGPLLKKMREVAAKDNLPVDFLGFVDDAERDRVFKSADFHLATSVREGWGMTVTEAACQGCLTIGYDVPGLRDSVKLANGRISSADPKSAAQIITNLLQDKVIIQATEFGGLLPWSQVASEILEHAFSD
jgi:glycosyltransferase involved in cell wall biosynthesis